MGDKKSKNTELSVQGATMMIDENALFECVSAIIENRKHRIHASVNSEATLMYWEVGQHINSVILDNKRAEYGKKILTTLSSKLVLKHGNSFSERNLYRMMLFFERFLDMEILTTLSSKLSWSHFTELLPLKTDEARVFYGALAADKGLSIKGLRYQISRKAYERREIANTHLTETSGIPFNVFKDPYYHNINKIKIKSKNQTQAIISSGLSLKNV